MGQLPASRSSIASSRRIPLSGVICGFSRCVMASQAKPRKMKKPRWLSLLLKSTFFGLCQHHGELKKSEVNTYCLDCGKSMCPHCWSSLSPAPGNPHDGHRFLQIRRYVYQDVVRVSDLQKYVDCSKVQVLLPVRSGLVRARNPWGPCDGILNPLRFDRAVVYRERRQGGAAEP